MKKTIATIDTVEGIAAVCFDESTKAISGVFASGKVEDIEYTASTVEEAMDIVEQLYGGSSVWNLRWVDPDCVYVVFDQRLNRDGDPTDEYTDEFASFSEAVEFCQEELFHLTASEKAHRHIYIGEMPSFWNDDDLLTAPDPIESWEIFGEENLR